jgi:hypothetical protein
MSNVILSVPMLLEDGVFERTTITLEEAKKWVTDNSPVNYVGHSTVRILGIEPSTTREVCEKYTQALCLKVNGRLDFGKEYTVEEVLAIGITVTLITKKD